MSSALGSMPGKEAQEAGVSRARHQAAMQPQGQLWPNQGSPGVGPAMQNCPIWDFISPCQQVTRWVLPKEESDLGRGNSLPLSNPGRGQQAKAVFPLQSQQLGQQICLERGPGGTPQCPPQVVREGALCG